MEGILCYLPSSDCNETGLELPIWEYSHDQGNTVIGCFVYHGALLADPDDAYVYGDYGSGKIWTLLYNGIGSPTNVLLADTNLAITSFELDEKEELYLTAFDGKIYTLSSAVIPEYPSHIIYAFLLGIALAEALIVRKKNHFAPIADCVLT
jgi:hypothetical protein